MWLTAMMWLVFGVAIGWVAHAAYTERTLARHMKIMDRLWESMPLQKRKAFLRERYPDELVGPGNADRTERS